VKLTKLGDATTTVTCVKNDQRFVEEKPSFAARCDGFRDRPFWAWPNPTRSHG